MWWGSSDSTSTDEEEKNSGSHSEATQSSSVEKARHNMFKTSLLPHTESRTRNCWEDPPADSFSVRGKGYLEDRKKIKATHPSQYALLGLDMLHRARGGVTHVAKRGGTPFATAREQGFKGFVFILNFVLTDINLICYWTPQRNILTGKKGRKARKKKSKLKDYLTGHEVFDNLMETFVESDDEYRNSRLKVIPMLFKGNWLLSQVVNGRPAIMCNKIKTLWYRDLSSKHNYLEADIEIQSSSMAMGILQLVKMSAHTVALDMAFTIEGQDKCELPEEILCALRFHHLEPDKCPDWPKDCISDKDSDEEDSEEASDTDSLGISESTSKDDDEYNVGLETTANNSNAGRTPDSK